MESVLFDASKGELKQMSKPSLIDGTQAEYVIPLRITVFSENLSDHKTYLPMASGK